MRLFVVAFAAGICVLQAQAVLPSVGLLAAACALALVAGLVLQKSALMKQLRNKAVEQKTLSSPLRMTGRRELLRLLLGALIGFVWAAGLAHWRLADHLPAVHEGRDIELTGVVATLPQEMERGVRFEFDVEGANLAVPSRISLAWYRGRDDEEASAVVPVRAGERWRFTVRLKRPHGNVNPDGFDYEAWLFERGIRATGYVRPGTGERLAARVWRPAYAVEMLRETLRDRYRAALPEARYAGVLVALAIGDQRAIDPVLWQRFASTGITHLMSISGLHITMLAGLGYALTNWLWRRSPRLPLYLPAQKAAAIGGLFTALVYSLLAGFAVPAQRTFYMLGVVALARLWGHEPAASRVLAAALFVVLALDPWAVLAAGFWLSFGAVALLFYIGNHRLSSAHWLVEWSRAQWAVTLGMLPALLALFQQFSLVSPLANAVAIPVISFLVTPLTLAGALPLFDFLLLPAHWITAGLMLFIDGLAALPIAMWQQAAPPAWSVVLALAGGAWLMLPRGFPARWIGVFAFLPLLSIVPPRPAPGAARVTVLDVGQGLAVHVQTTGHDLLFDAGPAFSADADSGNRIIVPYLRAQGVRRLDSFVVSHADKDHEGGAASVLAALPVTQLKTSLPFEHPLSAEPVPQVPCRAADRWEWDDVRFEMLHPPEDLRAKKTNDVSCVLRVEAGGRVMLLTSDIEAAQESALVTRRIEALRAEILMAPHHGSRSSSTAEFIAAVGAREVIFPVGYRNRYGHPADDVLGRYRASGARLHRTDADGAVVVDLSAEAVALRRQREEAPRYWMGR